MAVTNSEVGLADFPQGSLLNPDFETIKDSYLSMAVALGAAAIETAWYRTSLPNGAPTVPLSVVPEEPLARGRVNTAPFIEQAFEKLNAAPATREALFRMGDPTSTLIGVLRYGFDLNAPRIAKVLGKSREDVAKIDLTLHKYALVINLLEGRVAPEVLGTGAGGPSRAASAIGGAERIPGSSLQTRKPAATKQSGAPVLLRTKEVARLFDVTDRTVINWARSGKIPVRHTVGGHLRFVQDEIFSILEGSA